MRIMRQIAIILIMMLAAYSVRADYRNFYGISWRGTACDNIDYAKSMGYDYVSYQSGMEKCPNAKNLGFFIEAPDTKGFPDNTGKIDLTKTYTSEQAARYNDFFLWKSSSKFPNNLATGWFSSSSVFRPLPDFQRQEVIDTVVRAALADIPKKQNLTNNFYFAGYTWDVPQLAGDLWTIAQSSGGKQTTIKYWTGTDSGIKHPGKTYQYATYQDGQAAFRKGLFAQTRALYPNMKVILEPNLPYENYMKDISGRSDAKELAPDLLCEEEGDPARISTTLKFVYDTRLFDSSLLTKSKACSTTPKAYDHTLNLRIAGAAATNNAWYTWFGRPGGTGNMPNYQSIRDVPARLKLIRAMVGWDNLNGAISRSWNENTLTYQSSNSYADKYVIYSRHPANKKIYAVVLDNSYGRIKVSGSVKAIYNTDSLFRKTTSADSSFTKAVSGSTTWLSLKDSINLGKGYIIETA